MAESELAVARIRQQIEECLATIAADDDASSCSVENDVATYSVEDVGWLAYTRYRMSQGRNRVPISGGRVIHGDSSEHIQSDSWSR